MDMLSAAYETRRGMIARLEEDLLGGPHDDVLEEAPLSRFVVGVLFPQDARSASSGAGREAELTGPEAEREVDIDAQEAGEGPETFADPGVSMARVRYPSSIGLTFAVRDTASAAVDVAVSAYEYAQDGDRWVCTRREDTVSVDLMTDQRPVEVADGLRLHVYARWPLAGARAVTVALVNTRTARPGERDGACWFSPVIEVTPRDTTLCERPAYVVPGTDEDEVASQALLYRDVATFAVGHGCGAEWDGNEPASVRTTFLPRHELLLSEAAGGDGAGLGMDELAEAADFGPLEALVEGYREWIARTRESDAGLGGDHDETLARHMNEAEQAADRMADGVRVLREDEDVRRAFRLMNRAMAQQRSRQEFHRGGGIGDPQSTSGAKWRPFQIAFILTNLRGLTDASSDDRKIADVLWFPTGGGKTEAYLGLIGIAVLLRRIRDPRAAGVSVLMRYTLRLLTLQQFERATGLICALEQVRSQELPDTEPISIGLWVGQGSTPNSVKDAEAALKVARRGGVVDDKDGADPVQLRACPWCGSDLDASNYHIVENGTRMVVKCANDACRYRSGLPVHIIDSDVYTHRPSLVIGTVDKFAMVPWKAETGALLGRTDDRVVAPSPDLVIQDELHLISGPLGTMVGLYETAIDALLTGEASPKIVASTATIRRAAEQVRAVFAREARQFPPAGASHRDSYFSVEVDADRKASRQYVGVMAPGSSHATLMIRVYASLLQSAAAVAEDDPTADLYWTLLGYFNSLRVLGGSYMQIIDDVPDQMKVVARRRGEVAREIGTPREMTSRKKSGEIPAELRALACVRGDKDSPDVVLATNMISVGVDVDRLGLMAVMGQPQTTSEYIQATSRVGRRNPGLVVTIYNASRSRDLSHYENFVGYHRALYRHVEATSATPFAPRARDRALHAVLVSMARHGISGAEPNKAAGNVDQWTDELEAIVEAILARLAIIHGDRPVPGSETRERVEDELRGLMGQWRAGRVDRYEGWYDKRQGALLGDASGAATYEAELPFPPTDTPWATLTSMRDVDAESSVYLDSRRRG